MKFLDVALWCSAFSSSFCALSPSPTKAVPRSLTPTLDIVNTTLSNVTSGDVTCRITYGTGLKWSSCSNAWMQMPRNSDLHLYGLRTDIAAGAHIDVGLPVRYLSGDALCAIDIRALRDSDQRLTDGDSATNLEVSEAAKGVLDHCVDLQGKGGAASRFSRRGLLVVVITAYEPKAVCEPYPEVIPFAPFCENVLQTMPARRQKDTFAFSKDRQESVRSHVLPRTFFFRQSSTFPVCQHSSSGCSMIV